jgi:hypothetical protein
MSLCGCGTGQIASSLETPALTLSTSAGLFIDTDAARELPAEPQIVRSRFVKVNLALLLDEAGQARDVKEIALVLFSDVVYTGVIEQIEQNGDGLSWVGYLKDVEYSELTMVYTSGVFIGHFASPLGVYEVSIVDDGLYRVIMIDQSQFPGGEG